MKKRLYRSRKDVVISGVCGGIANYLDIDPVIVRILAVLIAFGAGSGIMVYIVAAIVIPKEPYVISRNTAGPGTHGSNPEYTTTNETSEATNKDNPYATPEFTDEKRQRGSAGMVIGLILILFGILLLVGNFVNIRHLFQINMNFIWTFFNYLGIFFNYLGQFAKYFWPICLIALGLVFFVKSK